MACCSQLGKGGTLLPRCGGFTLMELLVVIALIGVVIAMVLPSFRLPQEDGQGALREIQSFVEQARNRAMHDGEMLRLEIDVAERSLKLFPLPEPGEIVTSRFEEDEIKPLAEQAYAAAGPRLEVLTAAGQTEEEDARTMSIYLRSDGTVAPFLVRPEQLDDEAEPNASWQLVYNGTVAPGRVTLPVRHKLAE